MTTLPGAVDVAGLALGAPVPVVHLDGHIAGALCVVDLDAPLSDRGVAQAVAVLQDRAGLVVGVARRPLPPQALRLVDALDLTLAAPGTARCRAAVVVPDVDAALELVRTAVETRPHASLVLASLLRQTARLPVPEGLAAEASAYSTLLAGPEHRGWLAARGPGRLPLPNDVDRVRLAREGDRLDVRLIRPSRRNALDAAMRRALVDAFDIALAEPGLEVHVSGEGPVFSAGGDLDEFGSAHDPATAWVVRVSDSPGRSLSRLGRRGRVFVHGSCVGAGVEIPAFAGTVVADPATTFRLPEVGMGLVPGAGGTVSVTGRIGRWRTAWLGLTGTVLDAPTALAWGLVDAVEPRPG